MNNYLHIAAFLLGIAVIVPSPGARGLRCLRRRRCPVLVRNGHASMLRDVADMAVPLSLTDSRRLVGRNPPDLWRKHVLGRFEIEACLHIHPERSAGLEKFAEP